MSTDVLFPRVPPVRPLFAAAALLVLALLAAGCSNTTVEYRTEKAATGDIEETVTATGTVNPVTTVQVGTQVSGTIKSIFVDFNSPVRKGQLIALIDPTLFETQLAQAQANADRAEAGLRDAERVLNQNKALYAKNLVAKNDYDSAVTANDSAKAQLAQARAALQSAATNLSYTKIYSPVDGVVISRNVDIGQTVAASFQTPTLFTIAQDLTKMQIDTNVAESDIGKVKVGQDVEFTVDAYPDTTFDGKVWQVRRAPITVQNVVTYDVVIQVSNRDLKLMPGMTANVSVITNMRENVLRIPNAALRFRPERPAGSASPAQAAGGKKGPSGPAVWVLENGKSKRAGVTLGISDGTYTEVLSGEVKEGQDVIVEAVKKGKGQDAGRPAGPRMF
ncbi:MAG: efflux RND transporter periplasmic adaptor subunit [Nitrospiraceae bacterium]|nr:efflux RND transporter periplasmic adaptor subunit [Nitrospiraceae bacterium]